ncbi:hypothetical protein CORC01_01520 [Colletotrichum orchidophilum]|uniref:Uncharacterized protein n=1 Tax=Colletotrichum orchidophilum TaxID=1209926 RepID=A0A1G4BPD1_9PEZI|nr:uncharacterized protein CORC01_01520 [Colletotrichum orchidophilum]OHF03136.1 hypothetical protein CORC01_01520 [Colletotrichum orchidophilum]
MASRSVLAIAAVVLFFNFVLANPLPLFDDSPAARTLWSRGDNDPLRGKYGFMVLTIPPSDTTETQVATTAGGGGLGAFAVLNQDGSIFLAVQVNQDYVSDEFDGLRGYRITVLCHETTIIFEQPHDLLLHDRRALWARVSEQELNWWREIYETNEDSDIDITIWWMKDIARQND